MAYLSRTGRQFKSRPYRYRKRFRKNYRLRGFRTASGFPNYNPVYLKNYVVENIYVNTKHVLSQYWWCFANYPIHPVKAQGTPDVGALTWFTQYEQAYIPYVKLYIDIPPKYDTRGSFYIGAIVSGSQSYTGYTLKQLISNNFGPYRIVKPKYGTKFSVSWSPVRYDQKLAYSQHLCNFTAHAQPKQCYYIHIWAMWVDAADPAINLPVQFKLIHKTCFIDPKLFTSTAPNIEEDGDINDTKHSEVNPESNIPNNGEDVLEHSPTISLKPVTAQLK